MTEPVSSLAAARPEAGGGSPVDGESESLLCRWLPRLVTRSAGVTTASDFYPALLALLDAYCRRLVEELRPV